MKRETLTGFTYIISIFTMLTLSGCASMALHGGTLIDNDDIKEYIVSYRAEGPFPDGATYHLVRTDNGVAIYEQVNGNKCSN